MQLRLGDFVGGSVVGKELREPYRRRIVHDKADVPAVGQRHRAERRCPLTVSSPIGGIRISRINGQNLAE
jgi:hypothetical protein